MSPEDAALQLTLKAIENKLIIYPSRPEDFVKGAVSCAEQVAAFYAHILKSLQASK
jgi:hypothetical protein